MKKNGGYYYVYILLHPLLYPIYVGQSVAPKRRKRRHARDYKSRRYTWMILVGVRDSKIEVDNLERWWIRFLTRIGCPLENALRVPPKSTEYLFIVDIMKVGVLFVLSGGVK